MNLHLSQDILEMIFDEAILCDIGKKTEKLPLSNSDGIPDVIANNLISYVKRHYNVFDGYVTSKISNFYGKKHRKFTRFILVSISLFGVSNYNTIKLDDYGFNKSLKWEIEHIVPQSQKYNRFNVKNAKLKNRLGNLTILTKDTNVEISNKSFIKKCKGVKEFEKELIVNEVFNQPKTNFSKKDICARERKINALIYEIFFKEEGKRLREILKEYCDGSQEEV